MIAGSVALQLSRVHWVRAEVVVEVRTDLDGGQPAAAGVVSRAARGQTSAAGRAGYFAAISAKRHRRLTAPRRRINPRTTKHGTGQRDLLASGMPASGGHRRMSDAGTIAPAHAQCRKGVRSRSPERKPEGRGRGRGPGRHVKRRQPPGATARRGDRQAAVQPSQQRHRAHADGHASSSGSGGAAHYRSATDAIRIDSKVVAMNVSDSFAHVWLIPRLPDFQKRHPGIAIDMGTARPVVLDDSVELAISYSTHEAVQGPPGSHAIELLKDFGLPMAAPGLALAKSGGTRDIRALPLISSTPDDWTGVAGCGKRRRFRRAACCLSLRYGSCRSCRGRPVSAWRCCRPTSASRDRERPGGSLRRLSAAILWRLLAGDGASAAPPAQLFATGCSRGPGIRPHHQHGGSSPP